MTRTQRRWTARARRIERSMVRRLGSTSYLVWRARFDADGYWLIGHNVRGKLISFVGWFTLFRACATQKQYYFVHDFMLGQL